jgi:hypothetical protein
MITPKPKTTDEIIRDQDEAEAASTEVLIPKRVGALAITIIPLDEDGQFILREDDEPNHVNMIFCCPAEASITNKQVSLIQLAGKVGAISGAILDIPTPEKTNTIEQVKAELTAARFAAEDAEDRATAARDLDPGRTIN